MGLAIGPALAVVIVVAAVLGLGLSVVALLMVRSLDDQLAAMVAWTSTSHERLEYLRRRADAAVEAEEKMAAELAEALDLGTSGVRDVHRAIADIPFDILGAIPGTAAASGRVREVHDRTADGVYDAISAVNKAASEVYQSWVRKRDS